LYSGFGYVADHMFVGRTATLYARPTKRRWQQRAGARVSPCWSGASAEDGDAVPGEVGPGSRAMSGAALPGQTPQVVLDSSSGDAVQRDCLHVPVLVDGDPSSFVQSVAAKGARQVAQVPAFVIAAEGALLHMRGYQEPIGYSWPHSAQLASSRFPASRFRSCTCSLRILTLEETRPLHPVHESGRSRHCCAIRRGHSAG